MKENTQENKRAIRRHHNERIIKKRLKLVQNDDLRHYKELKDEAHRLCKKHPYDCGSQCFMCHGDKLFGKMKHSDKKKVA